MAEVDKWEYTSIVIEVDIHKPGAREYIKKGWLDIEKILEYSWRTLNPILDELGEAGWELIHIEPLSFGSQMDIWPLGHGLSIVHSYRCVLKRKKQI
jgi:hypothetical protein